jgi:peptidoglycan lytic transglycosylase G
MPRGWRRRRRGRRDSLPQLLFGPGSPGQLTAERLLRVPGLLSRVPGAPRPAATLTRMVVRAVLWVVVACLAVAGFSASGWAADTPPGLLRIVFPEGWSARQMADRVAEVRRIAIERRGVTPHLTGTEYARAVRRARPLRGFRAEAGDSVEGFLFPALYDFEGHTSAETLVANQLAAFEQRWRTVDLRAARRRGRTPYEVLTIASMVERETVAPEERRLGIPGTKPLTKAHLASGSPYNTRRFRGLPPTPIGNPGLASIRAAASPASVDYLYYVRKPDEIHHFFTADDEEFCRKAREYGYSC